MNTSFSTNLKKYRLQRKLTQEQIADSLGLNSQTISRWECGTTLPDITVLPDLARILGVSIDDFFKATASVYQNYAQRLASIYEKTRDPEDFLRADMEFRRLQISGAYSTEDMRFHGMIHQYMMWYCKEKAMGLYNAVIEGGPADAEETYWHTRHAKINLMVLLGQSEAAIREQAEMVDTDPANPREWGVLVRAYYYAKQYEKGYTCYQEAVRRFPDCWQLYAGGGDICWKQKRYEEAFACWDRVIVMRPDRLDARFSKARCLEELGQYERAYKLRTETADFLRRNGYDVEAAEEEKRAKTCFEKYIG